MNQHAPGRDFKLVVDPNQRFDVQTWQAPGAVGAAFIESDAIVNTIAGPIGSGKTNCAIMRMLKHAYTMPVCSDGWRYWRGMCVRDTYRNLYETTLATWHQWFPKHVGKFTGGSDRPANHVLKFNLPDGSKLQIDMTFKAMQNTTIEGVTRGWEGAWAWMNEGDLFDEDVLTHLVGRVTQMRYPPRRWYDEGQSYEPQVIIDYNPPDMDHWLYFLREERQPEDYTMFWQPSGLCAQAENVQNLASAGHTYEKLAKNNPKWWVQRFVKAEYGYDRSGEPVYVEYDDHLHCSAQDLEILDRPLRIGLDQDLHAAAIIGQLTSELQLRIPGEVVPGRMGATRFAEYLAAELEENYRGLPIERVVADPSGFYGADKEGDELAWAETVSNIIGEPIYPAVTNELSARLDGVRGMLTRLVPGGQPELLISRRCRMLRKGFMSHYRYKKVMVGNTSRLEKVPDKNDYSNPHDGLQYLVLDVVGYSGVTRPGDRRGVRGGRPRRKRSGGGPRTDFNVMDV